MVRPPPLQLRIDNYLPNLGLKPKRSFLTKVYEVDWRIAVIAAACINSLRYFIQASNFFHDRNVDMQRTFTFMDREERILIEL